MAEQRTLRSKRLRNLLWLHAEGKCAICGGPLPEGWHADHVVPFRITHRTNVHEMQASCPACNLSKGGRYVTLRKHQQQFLDIMRRIRGGSPVRRVIAHVTPGGGKSALPVIAAGELIKAGLADKICWVAPRVSLLGQAEDEFEAPSWRNMLGHDYRIRISKNDYDPCRNTKGYAITKQALVQDAVGINAAEFERHRYILVIDEGHHIAADNDGGFFRATSPLVERAAFLVVMSGTLERNRSGGGQARIAHVPYRLAGGLWVPDLENPPSDTAVVVYGREEALREKAIIPLHVVLHDAHAAWIDQAGNEVECDSFDKAGNNSGAMRKAVLKTEYADAVLAEFADHWTRYREQVYRRSKSLVVAPDQKTAKAYVESLRRRGIRAYIATSDDSKEALATISRFKERDSKVDCLVTVAMAYEGLDCPMITHICALTDYRSRPWIEQMIARATRFNRDPAAGPWECQFAYLFAPDDGDMRDILQRIKAEEIRAIGDRQPEPVQRKTGNGPGGGLFDDPKPNDIVPLASRFTRARANDLDGPGETNYAEHAWLKQQLDAHHLSGTTTALKELLLSLNVPIPSLPVMVDPRGLTISHSEQEARLRNAINERCLWADNALFDRTFGKANGIVKAEFGKSRDEMTLAELQQCWQFVTRRFRKEEMAS